MTADTTLVMVTRGAPWTADLTRAAVAKSGLSQERFAIDHMGRDARTIRRWLAGGNMGAAARAWLEAYLAAP